MIEQFSIWRELYGITTVMLASGLIIGLLFGICAERTEFCTRSAFVQIITKSPDKNHVYLVAFAALSALVLTQAAVFNNLIDLSEARETTLAPNLIGITLGTFMFGGGMALARGCVSRLLILSGRGNVRALITLTFFAVFALAAISGILAMHRLSLASLGRLEVSANLPFIIGMVWFIGLSLLLVALFMRSPQVRSIKLHSYGLVIGAIVPLCFYATSVIGLDDFDPVPVEGLRFILPAADSLAYMVYSTALTPKFGIGLILGTFIGAMISAIVGKRWRLEGFDNAPHPLRYILGAFLMGFGGVIAGGCSIGWLLTSGAAFAIATPLALFGFMAGFITIHKALKEG